MRYFDGYLCDCQCWVLVMRAASIDYDTRTKSLSVRERYIVAVQMYLQCINEMVPQLVRVKSSFRLA